MKLEYFDLLDSSPITINNVGSFISPKVKAIHSIGKQSYELYLSFILMTPETYYITLNRKEEYENLSVDEKIQLNIFNLFIKCDNEYELSIRNMLVDALNFFMVENVMFSDEYEVFVVYDDKTDENGDKIPVGVINENNFSQICDIITQLNYIQRTEQDIDVSKIKNKKVLERMKMFMKGREAKQKTTKADKNIELGNVISKVTARHPSINHLNVGELTIYQLYDTFYSLINQTIFDFQSSVVCTNGSKSVPDFDLRNWFKNNNN